MAIVKKKDDVRKVVREFSKDLKERVIARAGVRAINKTATSTSAALARRLREEWTGLKVADIKKSIEITRAKRTKKIDDAKAVLTVRSKAISLGRFGPRVKKVRTARGTRYGVTVKVKGQRKLVRGGFLVRLKKATTYTIFRRVGRERFPIERVPGINIFGIVTHTRVFEEMQKYAIERLAVVLRQELKYELRKQKDAGKK